MLTISVFVFLAFLYSVVSRRLESTVITAPIVFVSAGIILTLALPGLRETNVEKESFLTLAEIGLVMLLFTDATHVNLKTLRSKERLSLRLLSIGMLLTIILGLIGARIVLPGLSLWEAGILASILAPTDAGLGQVIVQSPRVPLRIRQSLDVEAGLNDGLSVPFLMFFLAVAEAGTRGGGAILLRYVGEQLGMGALVGLAVGFAGGGLLGLSTKRKWMAESAGQLGLVALPILSALACEPVGGSMFIAAYVAGLSVQAGFRDAVKQSVEFTEGWGKLFSYFIFFLFGLLATPVLRDFKLVHGLYAILSLTVIRMVPVAVALMGTRLSPSSLLFMGWFGPRGLASIVLGLVFLEREAQLPGEETIKLAVTATVMLSIFAHGFSALPGINVYSRKVAELADSAPERVQETGSAAVL
jgi:NhaP-type Na+/H+ or K+/H+ antiporter